MSSKILIHDLPNLQATTSFGLQLAQILFPGAVVGLIGQLGAGKTHLVRAIAEGLDVAHSRVVSSPTFVLIQEYDARIPIYHFDAYRLRSAGDFFDLGVQEYFAGQGVCLVEWADRVENALPAEHLRIMLTVTGETSRQVQVSAVGQRYEGLLAALRQILSSAPAAESGQSP